ncbi:hypothetical protein CAEBREN_07579 [Caenorhabditis brenneri]|uniref:Uncharacterized protein n=1 Tax=Caenorhabditis brenneri TaxID=135651 RepID=G0PAB3_CAEBE|nr:hypothetical protein CAEBREN_07579 [Caenorhabditis brenneri]
MLNLKLLSFLVIVIAIALVWSAANDGGATNAKNAAASGNFSAVADLKGRQFCPEKDASGVPRQTVEKVPLLITTIVVGINKMNVAFALQIWVYIVLAVHCSCNDYFQLSLESFAVAARSKMGE